jgi:glycosyltransferase involved in cell wall biosynthesis
MGGYDCVSFPEIRYGAFNNRLMKPFVKASYRRAHLLLPVHEALVYKTYEYFNATNKAQGFEAYTGRLKTPHQTIYNGYDIDKWYLGNKNLTPSFLTVAGGCEEKRRRILKGVDLFIQLARSLPEFAFTIVGANSWGEELPNNVKLIPRTKNEDLLELYQSNMFYVQLSLSEGFPNALSEAMLCGCVPIVSGVSSMPDMVDGAGYVLHHKDSNELLHLVNIAISEYATDRKQKARNNIANRYTEERRGRELLQALRDH